METDKNGLKLYSCKNFGCRQSFKWASQLSRHKKVCTRPSIEKKKYDTYNGKFRCLACFKSYGLKHNFNRHIKSCNKGRHVEKSLKCIHCEKEFMFKSKLDRHIQQVHTGISKNCGVCGKHFRRDLLETHSCSVETLHHIEAIT